MARHTALWHQLDRYFEALESSTLADKSVEDYYYFAECFVRWIDGTFEPGRGNKQMGRESGIQIFRLGNGRHSN